MNAINKRLTTNLKPFDRLRAGISNFKIDPKSKVQNPNLKSVIRDS
jgi:hypothetical protein